MSAPLQEADVPSALLKLYDRSLRALHAASSEDDFARVTQRYEDAKLVHRVVALLGSIRADDVRMSLESIAAEPESKLRHFPFLKDTVEHSIERQRDRAVLSVRFCPISEATPSCPRAEAVAIAVTVADEGRIVR